jgi:hypothetical protein
MINRGTLAARMRLLVLGIALLLSERVSRAEDGESPRRAASHS